MAPGGPRYDPSCTVSLPFFMTTVLPVDCGTCGVALDLQIVDWDPSMTPIPQRYRCPRCQELHTVQIPGTVVFVAKRNIPHVRQPGPDK
jgi:hypothetical protein